MSKNEGVMICAKIPKGVMERLRQTVWTRKAKNIKPNVQNEIVALALTDYLDKQAVVKPAEPELVEEIAR